MDTDKFFQSKLFKGIIIGMLGVIILTFVFGLGVFVGEKRAEFSFKWADEYHNNFGGPKGGFLGGMMSQEFTEANGVFGQIIKVNSQSLTIKGKDNVEKIILVTDKTIIVYQRKNIKLLELKVGDSAVVVGEPNNSGQIEAELIRVMPAPVITPKL